MALEGGVCVATPDGLGGSTVEVEGHEQPLRFDAVFPANASQAHVYDQIGRDMVTAAYHAYNASCFAYGQSASGKSYTMMGVQGSHFEAEGEEEGLIPRISRALFATLERASSATAVAPRKVSVRVSYLEVYNEQLRDLLAPSSHSRGPASAGLGSASASASTTSAPCQATRLDVRENKTQGVFVHGLTTTAVKSSDQVLAALEAGLDVSFYYGKQDTACAHGEG